MRLRHRCVLAFCCALWCALHCADARAQEESTRATPALNTGSALSALRLEQLAAKRREGLWLLGWGAANVVAGTTAAIVARADRAWLAASVTTLSFGAINALLSLGLLDLGGSRARAIVAEHGLASGDLARARERERVAQLKSAQAFALNTGLDLFYAATGGLLFALAQRQEAERRGGLRASGFAVLAQVPFLLAFDVACWVRSNRRANALR